MTELQIIKKGVEALARELMGECHARFHGCYGCDYLAGRLEGILLIASTLAAEAAKDMFDVGGVA